MSRSSRAYLWLKTSLSTSACASRWFWVLKRSSRADCAEVARSAWRTSSSSKHPLPSASTTTRLTSRASASSSRETSPSPSVSSTSSDTSEIFWISLRMAPTTTPQTTKKPIPTWKKALCSNSNVSSSISPSPRYFSLASSIKWPKGLPCVTNRDKNRPMNPSAPISAAIFSTTDLRALGSLCSRNSNDSSQASSNPTTDSIATALQNSGACSR
mmetsp:Transcript_16237/g.25564  ORF Transcript_16237/g.25564 Transcript_16237/m.25564 type:complete len:214 (+) Transcript_16237:121-762(+)